MGVMMVFGWVCGGRYDFGDARFELFGIECVFTVGKSTEDVRIRIPDVYRDVVTYGFVYGAFA